MAKHRAEYYALTEIDYDWYTQAILRVLGPWYWQGGEKNDEWAATSILKLFRMPAGVKARNVKRLAMLIRTHYEAHGGQLHGFVPPILKLLMEIKEEESVKEPDLFSFTAA